MNKLKYFIFIQSCESDSKLDLVNSQENIRIGQTKDEIEELIAKEASCSNFVISDSNLYEYRYNLVNIYPGYKKKEIIIEECLWVIKNTKLYVWFSNGKAIDKLLIEKDRNY